MLDNFKSNRYGVAFANVAVNVHRVLLIKGFKDCYSSRTFRLKSLLQRALFRNYLRYFVATAVPETS